MLGGDFDTLFPLAAIEVRGHEFLVHSHASRECGSLGETRGRGCALGAFNSPRHALVGLNGQHDVP